MLRRCSTRAASWLELFHPPPFRPLPWNPPFDRNESVALVTFPRFHFAPNSIILMDKKETCGKKGGVESETDCYVGESQRPSSAVTKWRSLSSESDGPLIVSLKWRPRRGAVFTNNKIPSSSMPPASKRARRALLRDEVLPLGDAELCGLIIMWHAVKWKNKMYIVLIIFIPSEYHEIMN